MSRKMKGIALDSSSFGAYENAKTRFKHQTLMQDYHDLQKESEAALNKLETMKRRKLTLLAEVRFLRQRYKYLLKNKSMNPQQERELVRPQNLESQPKNRMKNEICSKKKATVHKLPPIFDLNQKGTVYTGKKAAPRKASPIFVVNHKQTLRVGHETASFGINHMQTLHGRKEATRLNLTPSSDSDHRRRIYRAKQNAILSTVPVIDLKEKDRFYSGNDVTPRIPAPVFDSTQKESSFTGKESSSRRAPIFDLNQISGEEDEVQNDFEPLRSEELKNGLIRGGRDEQLDDLKLSVCRNVGDGSARVGKRKISWQDPVALRV